MNILRSTCKMDINIINRHIIDCNLPIEIHNYFLNSVKKRVMRPQIWTSSGCRCLRHKRNVKSRKDPNQLVVTASFWSRHKMEDGRDNFVNFPANKHLFRTISHDSEHICHRIYFTVKMLHCMLLSMTTDLLKISQKRAKRRTTMNSRCINHLNNTR